MMNEILFNLFTLIPTFRDPIFLFTLNPTFGEPIFHEIVKEHNLNVLAATMWGKLERVCVTGRSESHVQQKMLYVSRCDIPSTNLENPMMNAILSCSC